MKHPRRTMPGAVPVSHGPLPNGGKKTGQAPALHGLVAVCICVGALLVVVGCEDKDYPPMDKSIFDNMKDQPRYEPYESSTMFADGTIAQHPPDGTVRRSAKIGRETQPRQTKVTMKLLRRGQKTFNIHCSPCHGQDGYGDGMVVRHGYPAPPSLHIKRLREAKDSYIRHVIEHGLGKMPPYDNQVQPGQRSAVIAYIRALQRSQHANVNALAADQRSRLEEKDHS